MNDWLHCNKCFIRPQPNKPEIHLYLVECGHVFCEACIKQVDNAKCLVCGKSNSFIPISKDMTLSALPFFTSIETQMKKIIEIFNFQNMHRQRLNNSQNQKYQYLKKVLFNCEQKMKALASDNRMMKNMYLNRRSNYRTPSGSNMFPTPEDPNDDNMSVTSSVPSFTPNIKSTPIPGYAHRVQAGHVRGVPIPHNQPHLQGATGYYRASPMVHLNRKFNMPPIHKPSSTTSSMSQIYGKRT